MRWRAFLVPAVWLFAVTASAGGVELAVNAGWTAPSYEQRFQYDPGSLAPAFPGVSIQQKGTFQLDARGGFAFGGGVTYYFTDSLGIEGRMDTVDFNADTVAPRFTARVDLPAPLPDLTPELDLGQGTVEVERLRPLSLNLKARTHGRTRFVASGGLSHIPSFRFSATEKVGLGITGLDGLARLEIPTVVIRAEAQPDEDDEGRFGFNLGAGIEFQLGDKIALAVEARAFRFQKQTLRWRRAANPQSPLEELLLQEMEKRLDPIELEPTYFQATGGIVLSF